MLKTLWKMLKNHTLQHKNKVWKLLNTYFYQLV